MGIRLIFSLMNRFLFRYCRNYSSLAKEAVKELPTSNAIPNQPIIVESETPKNNGEFRIELGSDYSVRDSSLRRTFLHRIPRIKDHDLSDKAKE